MTKLPTLLLSMSVTLACTACSDDESDGSELDGVWRSSCFERAITELTYDSLTLVGTYTTYADDGCATPVARNIWTGKGVVGSTKNDATRIDLAFQSFRAIALDAGTAGFFNQSSFCGLTGWAANVERDVLGASCPGFSIPVNGKSLDIYRVTDRSLVFGRESKVLVAPTEADRPVQLDLTRVFTR
jgi:hypothetical protein